MIDIAIEMGTAYNEKVSEMIKTYQTIKYHDLDDGDLELGIEHDYEVLTTGQHAGTTDIIINGKTHALSNNCVIDHNARINGEKLTWARRVPDAGIGPDNNGKLFWIDAANSEDIWAFTQQARENKLGGYDDWRPPNYRELTSIVDLGNCSPAIDAGAFPSTPADPYWSASTTPCNSANAFVVNFYGGYVGSGNKETNKFYARLVRG